MDLLRDRIKTHYTALLYAILLIAFALSLAHALVHGARVPGSLHNDSVTYYRLAISLLHKHSYEGFTYWPPAYSAFLAVVLAMAGPNSLWAVYLAQALLFVVTLLYFQRIALQVSQSKCVALFAVVICAFTSSGWQSVGLVMTEVFAGAVLTVMMWHLMMVVVKPTMKRSVIVGLLAAVATLTKPAVLPFAVAALFLIAFSGSERRPRLRAAAFVLIGMCVLLVPWTMRNYRVTGALVPIATGGGLNFWMGNWPDFYHGTWEWRKFPAPIAKRLEGKTEVEQDRILMRQGVAYIKEDPARGIGILGHKFSDLWLGKIGSDPRYLGHRPPRTSGRGQAKGVSDSLLAYHLDWGLCHDGVHGTLCHPRCLL